VVLAYCRLLRPSVEIELAPGAATWEGKDEYVRNFSPGLRLHLKGNHGDDKDQSSPVVKG
jgi:hypothetical protein